MNEADGPGMQLRVCTALFLGWSLMSFFARLGTRIWAKIWGLDDYAIVIAMVANLAHVAAIFYALSLDVHVPVADMSGGTASRLLKAIFVSQLMYIASIGLCRVSTSLLASHLMPFGRFHQASKLLAGICGIWTTLSLLVVAFREHVQRPWTVMDDTDSMFYRWVVVESSGLGLECAVWLLSACCVYSLHMSLLRRACVAGLLGARLLLIPIVVYRLCRLRPSGVGGGGGTAPWPAGVVRAAIATEASVQYSVFAAGLVVLKPLVRAFHEQSIRSQHDRHDRSILASSDRGMYNARPLSSATVAS